MLQKKNLSKKMGQQPNKYHVSDDGNVYRINDDGSFTSVGNIEDIETNNLATPKASGTSPLTSLSSEHTNFKPGQTVCADSSGNPDRPNSYLWLGIVSTLFLCWPLGIVSIFFSSKVNSNWKMGNYNEAENYSKKAKTWGIAAVICSIVLLLLCWLACLF